ncbi:MAG TPA: A/G-specific adenine glycosylase, partial [Verrucomicrobiae bacterium]
MKTRPSSPRPSPPSTGGEGEDNASRAIVSSCTQRRRSKVEGRALSGDAMRKCGALVPRLMRWYARNARDLPWRRTRDPYAIWISEIMLQQTQVKTVVPYWERWMLALPNIRCLARAKPQT